MNIMIISLAFYIDRQESQRQACSCPIDREELVDRKVNIKRYTSFIRTLRGHRKCQY